MAITASELRTRLYGIVRSRSSVRASEWARAYENDRDRQRQETKQFKNDFQPNEQTNCYVNIIQH